MQPFTRLPQLLNETTEFYNTAGVTYEVAHERVLFFKDVIENKGGRPPDFLVAAAGSGYNLLVYLPTLDADGFDVIFDERTYWSQYR